MPGLRYVLTSDAEEFAERTERLLSASLECNVLATVLMTVLEGSRRDPPPIFAIGITAEDEVAFAAMRTPPWPLLASPLEPADAESLTDRWLEVDPDVAGLSSVPETARAIAAAWERRTGGTSRRTFSEAMHVLSEVHDPPRPAPGMLRLPRPGERDLLVEWTREFVTEARLVGAAQAGQMVDARLRQEGLLVWDDGQPVSLVGVNPAVAGVVRIGPVYTPRPLRRRGYAGSAVAAVSRRALDGGADRCMLFTDLANPTSNKIYAEVGYRRCGEWEEIALERA
ncbi:MAG TPA: GNAT family N-acetyltransferase [Solirubrobacteraceae bacterium]|nr:GNAT family N-acetyltransferase [Solirubrobacteraceae bacterium]